MRSRSIRPCSRSSALLSVVTGVLFGVLPALRLSKYGERGHASAAQLSALARNSRSATCSPPCNWRARWRC